jgi:polysaccharide export outer membrane protein
MHKSLASYLILVTLALSCRAQDESLLIGPGDTLDVRVFDTPEMQQEVRVTDKGTVPLPFIGELQVAGKTPAVAAKSIETALVEKHIMLHPQVAVGIKSFGTQNVSVLGEVHNAGEFQITTPQPILKVLSIAGGLTPLADRTITIQRHHDPSQQLRYYVSNNAEQALAASANVLVYPGDTVVVPKAEVVYVLGDVGRPGGYPMTTNDSKLTVMQAIALAGWANNTSKTSRIRLIRRTPQGQNAIPIQLAEIQKGKQPDLTLQPNDVLYIPFSWMKNVAMSASSIAASTSSAAIYAVH